MSDEIYYLRLNSNLCTAEAWINGVPAARVEAGGCLQEGRPVHEFLNPGNNNLSLLLFPGKLPSQAMQPSEPFRASPGMFATLQLIKGPRGVFPDDSRVQQLGQLEWRPEAGAEVRPPVILETGCKVSGHWPMWTWREATVVAASRDLDRLVYRFLQTMAEGMSAGDPSLYLQAAATRFHEIDQAYSLPAGQAQDNFLKQWEKIRQVPGFKLELPTIEKMSLRVCGSGRLVDCVDWEFEPMLRAERLENGTRPIRYPARVAFFGRDIRIVR